MTTNDKIFQVLEETKTNWNVNKLPLVAIESNDHNLLNTETYGLFRSDTS